MITDGNEFLALVTEKLHARITQINQSLLAGEKEIEDMHTYYWDNYTEMDQYGYENFDNQQALLDQVNSNDRQLKLKHRFQKMLDNPFFGRIDFRYEDEEDPEIFYIGIGNFAEDTGKTPLIYDWRAPVSGLFYDFDAGQAYYEAPGGRMDGEITAKWQYKIRRGKMIYAFESDMKIDDEILKSELGANGDVQLKNIVRTIQKEQNAIIRNTQDKILVIQGVAGSGKTSVALHRIAYLLYHDRKHLKASNLLILSPNSVFSDYISHILPELGEENIQEMSLDLFAYRQLRDTVNDCEDKYDRMERNLADPAGRMEYWEKQSEDFINQMEGYMLELEDELMNFREIEYKNYHVPVSRLLDLFYNRFLEIPLLSRMDAVEEYLVDEYETLNNRDLNEQEREFFDTVSQEMYETKDLYILYSRFLRTAGYRGLPHVTYEKRKLAYEDVYPMLYMKYRLFTKNGDSNIKHLVVDEMQDYTALQYQILAKLFPCRMTILGDKTQTMEEERQDVSRILPSILGKNLRYIEMNKSYRNTMEIGTYAAALAGIEHPQLFERHGKPVVEKQFSATAALLDEICENLALDENHYETGAILTMTASEAAEIYELLDKRLGDKISISLMDRDSSTFCRGLTVTTFYLAKGLEFDQVFSVYGRQPEDGLIRQAKYICATRALHELYMYEIR